jgi:hypothetical protein
MKLSLLCTLGQTQTRTVSRETESQTFRTWSEMLFDEVIIVPGFYYTPALAQATGDWCMIMSTAESVTPALVAALRQKCERIEKAREVDSLRVTVHYRLDQNTYHTQPEYRVFKRSREISIPPRPMAGVEGLRSADELDARFFISHQRYLTELRAERVVHLHHVHEYLRDKAIEGDTYLHDRYLAELALRADHHLLQAAGEEALLPAGFSLTQIKGISKRRARALALAGIELPEHLYNVSANYIRRQLEEAGITVKVKAIVHWQTAAQKI